MSHHLKAQPFSVLCDGTQKVSQLFRKEIIADGLKACVVV